ncbi:hypothetical protein EPD60_05540 [Flaviaesturariibacter flavus]|uniref:Lipoprotein n=1 Tax=Flaviaesturariibacter flavus TaxID=2502780 RepID=A0A4V2NWK0_9BACT|nr:DUF6263 family protein [Flaviaesturariibacter flavus]TCJ17652.1 hypothetical protein EPD60_05540 [Flaviaesturariibacter flavus]
MKLFRRTLGAVLILSVALPACAQTKLFFNLQKGSTYLQRLDYDVESESSGQKVTIKLKGTYRVQVTGETDSTKILDVAYERIGMDMDLGTMTISGDSDVPANLDLADGANAASAVMGKMFAAMKGKTFQLTVNREGQVSAVKGMDALTDAVMASMDVPAEIKNGAREGFTKQFNESSIRQNFNQAFYIFPARGVKVGDSWSRAYDQDNAQVTTTYTVKTLGPKEVVLTTSSVIASTAGGPSIRGTGTGELLIDTKTGLVLRGQMVNNLDGDAKVTSKGSFEGTIK